MNSRSWLLGLLVLTIAVVHILSQFTNFVYPRADDGDFFDISHKIYSKLETEGAVHFLKELYLTRSWKPIFYPVFGSFALLLTGGHVVPALRITNLFFLLFIGWNTFGLLRLFIPRIPALLSACYIMLLPFVFLISDVYTAEIVLMASALGFFSCYFRKDLANRYYFGSILWTVLGLLNRPAEMLMIVFAVALFEVWQSIRKQAPLLLIITLINGIALLVLFRQCFYSQENSSLQWYFLIPFLNSVTAMWFARNRKLYFFDLCNFSVFAASAWYAPFGKSLYGWLYTSSVGPDAQLTGGRTSDSFLEFTLRIFHQLGATNLAIIFLSCLALLIISVLRGSKLTELFPKSWLLLLLSVTVPFVIGSFGSNADLRYYCSPMIIVFVLLLSLLFRIQTAGIVYLKVGLVGMMIFLGARQIDKIFQFNLPFFGGEWRDQFAWRTRVHLKEDPLFVFSEELKKQIPSAPGKPTDINSLNLNCDGGGHSVIDYFALNIRARELGLNWRFDRIFIHRISDFQDQLSLLINSSDYLILGPEAPHCHADFSGKDPLSVFSHKLLMEKKSGNLERLGFSEVGSIHVLDEYGNPLVIYLLKVMNRR